MLETVYTLIYIGFAIFFSAIFMLLADDILKKLCGKGIVDIICFWKL